MLRFIDAYVAANGMIGSKEICLQFNCLRPKASKVLKQYQDVKPSNLRFDTSLHAYRRGVTFEPIYLKDERPLAYLDAIDLVFGKVEPKKMRKI